MPFFKLFTGCIALAASSQAFQLAFFVGDHCRGQQLGTQHVSLADQKCFGPYVDNTRSVYIRPDEGDEDDSVAFYSSKDCNIDNVLADGNGDCLDIDNEYTGVYQSYAVIGGGKRVKLQKKDARDALSAKAKELYDLEEHIMLAGKNIPVHGQKFKRSGEDWRWHQIAHGAWSGVPVDKWDDDIHVPSDFFVDYSGTFNMSNIAIANERRDFSDGVCKTAKLCTATAVYAGTALQTIAAPWAQKVGYLAAHAGQSVWTFLGTPQAQTLAITTGGTEFKASDCSTTHDEIDALRTLVEQQGGSDSAMEVRIQNLEAQQAAILSIVARLMDKHPSNDCGASDVA